MATQKITIDPVTRIEGHLKITVEVDDGKVVDAYSSGTLWRGIEVILQGRDPRDAGQITQRICGVVLWLMEQLRFYVSMTRLRLLFLIMGVLSGI